MWQNSFKSSHKFQPTCRLVYNLGVTRMEKWMHGPCKNINHVKYHLFPREWVIKNGMELTDKTIRSKKMMTSNLKNWPRVVETSMFRGLKQKKSWTTSEKFKVSEVIQDPLTLISLWKWGTMTLDLSIEKCWEMEYETFPMLNPKLCFFGISGWDSFKGGRL